MIDTTIVYDNECDITPDYGLDKPIEEYAEYLLENVCNILECEYEAECSLVITTPDNIKDINRDFREIDSVTDVLSFPAIDFDYPCDYDIINEDDLSMFNPDTGELILGDMIICHDRVLHQAEEYGHSPKREFSFLIVHSLLHLFGYDHIEEEDRILMENMQRMIMDKLKVLR